MKKLILILSVFLAIVLAAKKKNIVYKSNSKDIYELRMQRLENVNDININQVITRLDQSYCDQNHINLLHNSTWSTTMCFERDISYQIFAAIGKPKQKNQDFLNLEVNINSPWTWIKSNNCRECDEDVVYNYQSLSEQKCQDECQIQKKNVTSKYDPYKSKENKEIKEKGGKKAAITANDNGVFGTFINYQLSFLAYNPNKNITVGNTIKEKISFGSYNALEDLITVKKMKVLHAEKLFNIQKRVGDGSIGLARYDEEFDSKNIEPDTHILKQLIDSEEEEDKGDFVFGVYINRLSNEIQDFAITFGGYNAEYSSEIDINQYFIDLKTNKKKSNFQYTLPLNTINFIGESYSFTEAYLTLNSSYLILPFDILNKIIKYMNDNFSMGCKIIDKKFLMVYCTEVIPKVFKDRQVDFNFNGLTISVPFRDFLHVCRHDKVSLFNQDISQSVPNQCVLSISTSRDNKVILGEVFLNKRYTIFDLENNRIGFLPPQTVNFFNDEDEKRAFVDLLMKIVTVIFIVGIISLYFIKSIMKCCNKIFDYFGRLIDIQKIPTQQSRSTNMKFQQINQNEGIEIQNNSIDFSFDTKDKRQHIVVPANVIPSFKLHPQKRKIFEDQGQKPQIPENKSQQQDQNTPKLVPPPSNNIDLL